MTGSHGQATRQPQLSTLQQVLHKNLTTLTVLLGWGPQAWWWISKGTKWRKVECHRNYSLALWVGGCPGVCITATFFFFSLKKKKKKKKKQPQIHVSSPTDTERHFFCRWLGSHSSSSPSSSVSLFLFSPFPRSSSSVWEEKFTLRQLERHICTWPNCCKWK